MQEQRFKVLLCGEPIARDLPIDMMLLFVRAFFDSYNAEDELTIMREELEDGNDNW